MSHTHTSQKRNPNHISKMKMEGKVERLDFMSERANAHSRTSKQKAPQAEGYNRIGSQKSN